MPVGRVETGVLYNNRPVMFMPSKLTGEVKTIETHYVRMEKAEPGDNIGFNVKGVNREDVQRGDVVGYPENPPSVANAFLGQIFVIYHPTALAQGYTPVLHIHTAQIAVKFAELVSKLDPRTGQVIENNPSYLKTGEAAIVRFEPLHPVSLEVFSQIPQLGRFAIRDMGTTIAAGIVKEIVA